MITSKEYLALQQNPYIELDVVANGSHYEVAYYYPDVFHYKKLVSIGRISSSLDSLISTYTPEQLQTDKTLRQKLNQV